MNKKFLSAILFGALMVTSTGTFVSCKDYDDDIENLQSQIDAQKSDLSAQITALQSALSTAQATADAAKKDAAAAAAAAKTADEKAALAAQAAAEAEAAAIAEAKAMVEELKAQVAGKVDQTVYDAKVKEIAEKISAIDTSLNKLTTDVDAHTQAINTLKIQMEAVQAYKDLINKKADATEVEALEKTVDGIKTTIASMATSDTVEAINKKVEEISNQIASINEALVTIQTLNLRSLVFMPSLYLDGVEAFRYPYAPGLYLAEDAERGKAEGSFVGGNGWIPENDKVPFVIPETSKWKYAGTESAYVLTPIDSIYYHLNPSNANLDETVWTLNSNDAEFVSRSATDWTPKYMNSVKNNGILSVAYKIKEPQEISVDKELMSVMSLNATLKEGKTVNSDYAAVLPAVQTLKAIAYKDITTPAIDCEIGDELWLTGFDAASNTPSVKVPYNKGSINLDDLLNIHYTQKDFEAPEADAEHKAMTYKVAKENYGLKFEYEMMPYLVGNNETSESMYGKVVDNMFYPCYVKTGATPTQVVCGTGNDEEGISAVGKMPIVLVRLVDTETDEVVLVGYIKLQIVKEAGSQDFVIKTFELPLICGEQTPAITWDESSDLIYEYTKYSKEEFQRTFSSISGPYVKTTNEANEVAFEASDDWGRLFRDADWANYNHTGSTNGIIGWIGDLDILKEIAEEPNRSKTLYVKYTNTDNSYSIYVGITIKVAEAPVATYGEKIAAYWYSDITGTAKENVRNNVPRPTTAGINSEDVLNYVKDLDDNFKGNAVKFELTSAAQNKLYKEGTYSELGEDYEFETAYYYQFAETQPKVGDYQLARNEENSMQLVTTIVDENEDEVEVLIAELDADGKMTYQNNATAQAILNLFSHSEKTANKMQYANIEIVSTYGSCEEPLGTYDFKVRFLRPVDILEGPNAFFEDAQANGSSVVLGDFIKLQDWRDMDLIKYNATSKKYESAVENECKLFDYYLFESIKIDLAKTSSTLTGKKELLSEVTDKLLLKVDNNGTMSEANESTTVELTTVDALNTTKIVYFNNEGNVQEFELYIPIEITYSWGTLKGEIVATVGKTKAN